VRPLPTDLVEYRRRRRAARIATLLVAVLAAFAVASIVAIMREGGDTRIAMVPYILLLWLGVLAWLVVVPLWRRSYAARPVTLPVDPTPGQVYGIPELDEPPRDHRGLSGQEPPPTRW
jgi:hypothetical protein